MVRMTALASATIALLAAATAAEISVDAPIMDHAVIQRDVGFTISGQASADQVTASFAGYTRMAQVEDGEWSITFPPLEAADGREFIISAAGETLRLRDVAVGDVVFCSGQSNMAWPMSRSTGAASADFLRDADARLLQVPLTFASAPQRALPANAVWKPATADLVRDFSAVCWFTAEQIAEDGIAIGLVQSAWGGSQIEAWVPATDLRMIGLYDDQLDLIEAYGEDPAAAQRAFGALWEASWKTAMGTTPWTSNEAAGRRAPDEPTDWKLYGDEEIADHFGYIWFSREVVLSADESKSASLLNIGLVDDTDATWVNGVFLGSTFSWSDARQYELPAGILRAGKNIITVNVYNSYGQGGLIGPREAMYIEHRDGSRKPIDTGWRYRPVTEPGQHAPKPPWSSARGFSTIHNAMVAPLANMKAAKAIWYQGESNTGRAGEYEALLQGLVESWKQRFGEHLESVVIQLPNFGAVQSVPGESGWAGVRAAQLAVAEARADTGLAVTIDAGDVTDIHPANKKIVADRVSLAFRGIEENEAYADGSGPVSAVRERRRIVVALPSDDYRVIGNGRPVGLEACTTDGDCEFVDGTLADDEIVIESRKARTISTVRYCWADAPICNIFTSRGAPVTPFEIAVGPEND